MEKEERKKIIKELQELAESVYKLKTEHRQKRPIIIEFSGSPKAGKTSCINSLELFLKRNGFKVKVVQERASVCPVSDKQSPMFNIWTACMSLAGLIGTIENKNDNVDVLILDRGIFDALCWFEWLVSNSKMEIEDKDIIDRFLLMKDLVKPIDIVFAFSVEPEISIKREYANLLTDKVGTIMNTKVLEDYYKALHKTVEQKKEQFHIILKIDTSNKSQDEVGKEVTEMTLNTLKDLLMEKIGYLDNKTTVQDNFNNTNIVPFSKDISLSKMKFGIREKVETNSNWIQPIPIAVITNESKDRVLIIKKNNKAVSDDSPEKGKELIYVGGHTRYEDMINETDFLSVCKTTLKREIKEEIGISIALEGLVPYLIYSKSSDKSQKHMAICFIVTIDESSVKLRLDPNELITKKGKSKSGRFESIEQIMDFDLEEWSTIILNHCFKTKIPQLSFFDKR